MAPARYLLSDLSTARIILPSLVSGDGMIRTADLGSGLKIRGSYFVLVDSDRISHKVSKVI